MDEPLLTVPTSVVDRLGTFVGVERDVARWLPVIFDPANLRVLPRSRAEDDPTHKQLVCYAVLCHAGRVFLYERGGKGGERRLHAKWSIGVGGHINTDDHANSIDTTHPDAGRLAYERGYRRELEEEVELPTILSDRIVGLVHDDRTPVGAVHLGVIHRVELASDAVVIRDDGMLAGRFVTPEELKEHWDRLESWSQFAWEAIEV